ncbi:hypothetical protein SLS56_010631 [Neofusicoccum ribis]|uniref:Heterokaryon incompatibility domain-containing protein n=1 Tax=Neofusicoccum ribis TaxID=45134 RepID=A0ABR3SDX3_9PEZI
MDFDFSAYRYEPLPTPTSIRLVRILRGRDPGLPTICGQPFIRLSMQTVDLAAAEGPPTYRSLSYTWDSPEPEWLKRKINLSAPSYGYSGADAWPVTVDGRFVAVRKNLFEALQQLQSRYSRVSNAPDPDCYNKTELHKHAEGGRTAQAADLIRRGASVGERDVFGETPLHYAAENGHLAIVRELVRAGADLTLYDDRGRTPLHCAVHRKRGPWLDVVRFLQDPVHRAAELAQRPLQDAAATADLEARGDYDKTALHVAAELGLADEVRWLLRQGASTSARDCFGETPLHYAAENGWLKIVKMLVAAGADVAAEDGEHRTPAVNAMQMERNRYREVAAFLALDEARRTSALEAEDWGADEDSPELFWIDAICINQQDLAERSAQVLLMPQIYGRAESVLVWFGNFKPMMDREGWEYDKLKALATAMQRVNAQEAAVAELPRRWRASLRSFINDGDMPADGLLSPDEIRQVTSWLTRAWFTRSWVVQELALARDIKMFAPEFEFAWSEVLKFLCLLFHAGYFDTASFWRLDSGLRTEDGVGGDGSEAWKLAVIRLRTANNPDEWALLDPIFRQAAVSQSVSVPRVRRHGKLGLSLLLAETFNFGVKDPRDKIYALMSLAATLPEEHGIRVDYATPVGELYTKVAHMFVQGSGTSSIYITDEGLAGILEPLEGLSYAQDPYVGANGKNPDLPSWVPDFSRPLTTTRFWSWRFAAATSAAPVSSPLPDRPEGLRVCALEIDEVSDVEHEWEGIEYCELDIHKFLPFFCRAWANYNEESGDPFLIAMLRTLVGDELWDPENQEVQADAISGFRDFLCAELNNHQDCLWGGDDACLGPYHPTSDPETRALRVDPTVPNLLEEFAAVHKSPELFTDLGMALNALRTKDAGKLLPSEPEIKDYDLPDWCEFHGPDCSRETNDRKDFRTTMSKYYRKRGLFRTKNGRIGLGPQSLRPGHRLVLVAGSRTPLAVREVLDSPIKPSSHLIGEVYLHGAMMGELVRDDHGNFQPLDLF